MNIYFIEPIGQFLTLAPSLDAYEPEEQEIARELPIPRKITTSRAFLKSQEWKDAREECLSRRGRSCEECGSVEGIQVDHKLPRKTHPQFSLDQRNLRPLCWPCNKSKSTRVLPHFERESESWK